MPHTPAPEDKPQSRYSFLETSPSGRSARAVPTSANETLPPTPTINAPLVRRGLIRRSWTLLPVRFYLPAPAATALVQYKYPAVQYHLVHWSDFADT